MKRPLHLGFFLLLIPSAGWSFGGDFKEDLEASYQMRQLIKPEGEDARHRATFQGKLEYSVPFNGARQSLVFAAAGRGWIDKDNEISVRQLTASWVDNHWRMDVGIQEISWGETFGLYIADLVNPRDYRDPLFNELSWIRVPTATWNTQFFFDRLSIQLVVTPVPSSLKYKEEGIPYAFLPSSAASLKLGEARQFQWSNFSKDTEAGAKVNYLTDFGLDLSFLYLYHWNRNLVFEQATVDGQSGLQPIQVQMHTAGATASFATGSWVFRNDTLLHLDIPQPDFTTFQPRQTWLVQDVFGVDLSTQSEWTFGVQYHLDAWKDHGDHWASARVEKKLFRGKLIPSIFVFRGLNNSDTWIQPQITWNVASAWTLQLRADIIDASDDLSNGLMTALKDRDRLMFWATYHF